MSLLGVFVSRIPLIASSPTCSLSQPSASSATLTALRLCSMEWSVWLYCQSDSRHRLWAQILCHASDEHTPINLSDSNRNSPHYCNATIAVTSEEPDVLRHSGALHSSQHTAATSEAPTVSGSLGCCLWKQLADYDSVDSQNSIRETGAELDRETVVSTLFRSESRGKRDRDQNVVQSFRYRENLHKILEWKAELAVRGEKLAQQKLYAAEAEEEAKFGYCSSWNQLAVRVPTISATTSKSMGRSGSKR